MPVAGGVQLAGDHATARKGFALEQQHLLAGFGQVGGSDESIVAGAHGDDVVVLVHDGNLRHLYHRRKVGTALFPGPQV